jgi:hypothetical protein
MFFVPHLGKVGGYANSFVCDTRDLFELVDASIDAILITRLARFNDNLLARDERKAMAP